MSKVMTEAREEADTRDETSGQIVFTRGENGSRQLKGATPDKLVERLTDPSAFGTTVAFLSHGDRRTIPGGVFADVSLLYGSSCAVELHD
jgi:hypothetical protein